jgi:hypothetical protein
MVEKVTPSWGKGGTVVTYSRLADGIGVTLTFIVPFGRYLYFQDHMKRAEDLEHEKQTLRESLDAARKNVEVLVTWEMINLVLHGERRMLPL